MDEMDDAMPDFSQFMAGMDAENAVQEQGLTEEQEGQKELAKTVLQMLMFSDQQKLFLPENEHRRLLFQGGFVAVGQIGSEELEKNENQNRLSSISSSDSKDGAKNIFASTKNFIKRKTSVVSKAITQQFAGESCAVQCFANTKSCLEYHLNARSASGDDMIQSFVFDDVLILAKPQKDSGELVVLRIIELLDAKIRDMGTGFFVIEDGFMHLDDDDDEEEEEEEEDDSPKENMDVQMEKLNTSHREKLSSMFELTDANKDCKYLIDTGDQAHKGVWLQQISDAIFHKLQAERPMRTSSKGWKHSIVRGTIWSAAMEGNVFQMGAILRSHAGEDTAYLDSGDEDYGMTAMHYAALKGQAFILKQLVGKFANVYALDNDLKSPLHYAASVLSTDSARVLLDVHADVDARDMKERTPLMEACASALAKLSTCSYDDDSKREFVQQKATEMINLLTTFDADMEAKDVNGNTVLFQCTNYDFQNGGGFIMSSLLKAGANPETKANGKTILLALCTNPTPDCTMISKVLNFGANPNSRDEENQNTGLHYLLGANEFQQEDKNSSGKLKLISDEQREAVALLISYGASISLPNRKGVSCETLLKMQAIDMDDAASRWQQKQEPRVMEQLVKSTYSYRVPYATAPGLANWVDDNSVTACTSCAQPFTLLNRRKHCRRCGRIFCSACTEKQFTLRPAPTNDASVTQNAGPAIKERVCIACFNGLSRSMTLAAQDFENVHVPTEKQRVELFGNRQEASQDKKPEQTKAAQSQGAMGAISQTLQQAQQSLQERAEKLQNLADKSSEMNNNASNFSSMARRLREREEKKSWFGFF